MQSLLKSVSLLLAGVVALSAACADTTPPRPPTNVSYRVANYGLHLQFTWDSDDSDYIRYLVRIDDGYWTAAESVWWEAYGGPITDGVHTFQIKAIDEAGNLSEPVSIDFEFPECAPECLP